MFCEVVLHCSEPGFFFFIPYSDVSPLEEHKYDSWASRLSFECQWAEDTVKIFYIDYSSFFTLQEVSRGEGHFVISCSSFFFFFQISLFVVPASNFETLPKRGEKALSG